MRTACSVRVIFGLSVPVSIAWYYSTGAVLCIQPSPHPQRNVALYCRTEHYVGYSNVSSCGMYTRSKFIQQPSPCRGSIASHENTGRAYIPVVGSCWLNVDSEEVVANLVRTNYTAISGKTASWWPPHQRGAKYTHGNRVCQLLYYFYLYVYQYYKLVYTNLPVANSTEHRNRALFWELVP